MSGEYEGRNLGAVGPDGLGPYIEYMAGDGSAPEAESAEAQPCEPSDTDPHDDPRARWERAGSIGATYVTFDELPPYRGRSEGADYGPHGTGEESGVAYRDADRAAFEGDDEEEYGR